MKSVPGANANSLTHKQTVEKIERKRETKVKNREKQQSTEGEDELGFNPISGPVMGKPV